MTSASPQAARGPAYVPTAPWIADAEAPALSRRRVTVILAGAFAAASLVRDVVLLSIFYHGFSPDSRSYLDGHPLRTRPYPLIAALTGASSDPTHLIWLQIVVAAVAVGLIVFMIGRWSLLTAAIAGLLLFADVSWAGYNRQILTESLFMSLSVITLVCLVYHYERRHSIRRIWLVPAGVLYGWTLLIKPSNIFLGIIIVAAYLVFTRSWIKAGLVAAGIVLVVSSTSLVTLAQTGHFRLNGGTGIYLAFPLFSYHLFSPANGPASAGIDAALKSCNPGLDYGDFIGGKNSDQIIYREFLPCLSARGWDYERISGQLTAAYGEAIVAHPRAWARSVLDWTILFITYQQRAHKEEPPTDCTGYRWCGGLANRVSWTSDSAILATEWEDSADELTSGWRQAFLYPRSILPTYTPLANQASYGPLPWSYVAATVLLWIIIVGFLWLTTRGPIRFLVFASIVLVLYTALSVAAGAYFVGRYADVLTPAYAVISAILLVALLRQVISGVVRVSGRVARLTGWLTSAVGAALLVAAALYVLLPPVLWQPTIQAQSPLHPPFPTIQGKAYGATLPAIANTRSDSSSTDGTLSRLTVYENGRRLGPGHSQHASIFDQGQGRFSHWNNVLYFSASDNTNPNLNGRMYTVGYDRVPPNLTFLAYLPAALVALLVALTGQFRKSGLGVIREFLPSGSGRRLEETGV